MAKKRERQKESAIAQPVATPSAVLVFLEKHAIAIAVAAVLLATIRIVATYAVYSHTADEPAHIACGMEWWDKGIYTCEPQHPPLARAAVALGPYLAGARSEPLKGHDFVDITAEGLRILYGGHHYDLMLSTARMGILPFFWLACWVVYAWGSRYANRATAALAVAIFTFVPTVLAHAGLATTDMPLAACLGAAFLTGLFWVEDPTPKRAAIFGFCMGLACLSKFSTLVYFPAAAALALLWYLAAVRPRPSVLFAMARTRGATFGLAVLISCVVIWAGYRFSFGKVNFTSISLPAPELYAGVQRVIQHNDAGHVSFFLGQRGTKGWWYFFPVLLLLKTPLACLILIFAWPVLVWKNRKRFPLGWLALTFAAAILMVGMSSQINLGLRHILPIFIGLSLLAAMAAYWLLEGARDRRWLSIALLVLGVWFAGSSLLHHPDYLPYFNELAGSHPENIVADSDLDWGQDLKRLAKRLKEVGAQQVTILSYYAADLEAEGIPKGRDRVDVIRPQPGWTAISISAWKIARFGLGDRYADLKLWPDVVPPTEKVGKGIFLYYFPPSATP